MLGVPTAADERFASLLKSFDRQSASLDQKAEDKAPFVRAAQANGVGVDASHGEVALGVRKIEIPHSIKQNAKSNCLAGQEVSGPTAHSSNDSMRGETNFTLTKGGKGKFVALQAVDKFCIDDDSSNLLDIIAPSQASKLSGETPDCISGEFSMPDNGSVDINPENNVIFGNQEKSGNLQVLRTTSKGNQEPKSSCQLDETSADDEANMAHNELSQSESSHSKADCHEGDLVILIKPSEGDNTTTLECHLSDGTQVAINIKEKKLNEYKLDIGTNEKTLGEKISQTKLSIEENIIDLLNDDFGHKKNIENAFFNKKKMFSLEINRISSSNTKNDGSSEIKGHISHRKQKDDFFLNEKDFSALDINL
ncbi:hypothetical protein AA101099_2084 [Neoasaia chiangmaiensis NBRC 101099]|nr:hypothetical protein AA101099_2084 [Neoasaia chiangmaiensis NBRC 101099]GEN13928.1 hypothetical protein NCH01_03590 [Neoasaia chiangmaiensis]